MKRTKLRAMLAAAAMTGLAGMASAKEYRMATVVPEGSPYGEVMAAWSAALKERSGGEIDIKIFFNGALGAQDATLRQAQRGRLEGAGVAINALATVLPEVTLMLEPYLFASDAVRHCVEDVSFQEIFGDRLEEAGYKIVGRLDIGHEYLWTKNPITDPEQMAGVKTSVPSSPGYERMMESTGAAVTVLGATELVPGLKTGTVDAVLVSTIYGILIGIPQLTGHAVNPGSGGSSGVIGFSTKTWNAFSAEEQELIQSTSDELFKPFRQVVAGMEAALIGRAKEAGLNVTEMDDATRAKFAEMVAATREAGLAEMGGTAAEDFAALQAAAAACAQ